MDLSHGITVSVSLTAVFWNVNDDFAKPNQSRYMTKKNEWLSSRQKALRLDTGERLGK